MYLFLRSKIKAYNNFFKYYSFEIGHNYIPPNKHAKENKYVRNAKSIWQWICFL